MEIEYKVLTSQTPAFAKQENIAKVMEQESRAGWQLLEKYDNYKLRVQRDVSHRENDKNLDFDPYNTSVGVSSAVTYGLSAATVIILVLVILNSADFFV